MTGDDVREIEQRTGFQLPQKYRSVLLDYPQKLIDLSDEYGQGPENYELYRAKDKLIAANEGPRPSHQNWRPEFFAIGDNGCGEGLAIDTSDPEAPVYVFSDHIGEYEGTEDGNAGLLCTSIDEWVERAAREHGG